jgi:hypothetical protein
MFTDHLERAAIEIHFALADISMRQTAATSAGGEEEDKALLAALRFALFELEWVRRRLDGGDALAGLRAAAPQRGVAPDELC